MTAAFLLMNTSLLGLFSLSLQQCDGDDDDTPYASDLLVGASVVTLLPEVDGSTSYFDPLRESPLALEPGDDGRDPGVFVELWDVGTIPIGNGKPSSHWVHDEIRGGAMAFKDLNDPDNKTLVLVTADVYMIFRQDIEELYDKVERAIGTEAFNDLWIIVTATHNHMGPDTSGLSGPFNHLYYEYMTSQLATAVVEAVQGMEAAELVVSQSDYQFGMADAHVPRIVDPTLNALQAVSATDPDRVIGTLVQWQSHPEETLGFGRDIYATDEQAAYLKSINQCYSDDDGQTCYVADQIISAGYAGIATKYIMDQTNGAPALYIDGPVGGLLGPLHAYTWETEGEDGRPAGNGTEIPEGAVIIPKNFHKAAVDGLELGRRALADLESGERVVDPAIRMEKLEYYGRLTNLGFRIGLSVKSNGVPLMLGHLPRELFICPNEGPWTDETCVSDNFESETDPYLNMPVRVGGFGKTEVHYVRMGPISMVTFPGEAVSELANGLPADFREDPREVYYESEEDRTNHADASTYTVGGYARQMMSGTYKWMLGLGQDELGYMIPISDWRIFCVGDEAELGGQEGNCLAAYQAGIMDYQDYDGEHWSISGARCKAIMDDPTLLEASPYTDIPGGADIAWNSCYYGQTWNDADGHYEETVSGGWDYVDQWLNALREITGADDSLDEINEDFIGYNLHD